LKSLKGRGLIVEDDNRFLSLSSEGEQLAQAVVKRKDLLLRFFNTVLGVGEEQAEIDACKTEHLLSAETTRKLEAFLDSVK
jgi:Mn-dependent DtxR family transcriptional regulator